MIYLPATIEDAERLAPHLRHSDILELWDGFRLGPLPALRLSVHNSTSAWAAHHEDGTLVAMFGVTRYSLLSGMGIPWMLARPMKPYARALLRDAPEFIDRIGYGYEELLNYVDARNHEAIRFLKRMGFDIHPPQPYGQSQLPFHPFTLEVSKCVHR